MAVASPSPSPRPATVVPTLRTVTPPDSDAAAFVLRLGRALHTRGIPSYRLEEAMQGLSRRLGLEGTFFSTPTAMFASFAGDAKTQVHLIRVGAGGTDLGRLADLDAVSTQVAVGSVSPAEGLTRVDVIESAPPKYGPAIVTACFALNSAAASVFFGAGVREVATALIIGLCTGGLALLAGRSARPWRAFEPVAAFCAAVLAALAARFLGPVSVPVAVLGGLVALLPGYTLTTAITEIATGHLASGSARLTSAVMALFTLAFGVALGTRCVELAFGPAPAAVVAALPAWVGLVALLCATSTFAILFSVNPRDLPWVMAVATLGFFGARAGSTLLGPELGVFVGAVLVGCTSNAYARLLDRPAVVPLFPGIILLVPGSIGFRSLSSLMAHDVLTGVQTAFTMILVAVGLVAGLLLANELVNPRRPL